MEAGQLDGKDFWGINFGKETTRLQAKLAPCWMP